MLFVRHGGQLFHSLPLRGERKGRAVSPKPPDVTSGAFGERALPKPSFNNRIAYDELPAYADFVI
ncbi:hypothetical protein AGMMS49545_07330 [Betaproteobacteria bacterium]|nr:hypothetical protein AGMMS49545_07330 [Betaproteobacteria bacterium]